jgi:putative oxidoreductase
MNAVPVTVFDMLGKPVHLLAKGLNVLQPLLALGVRIWVGLQFWKSGLLKLQSWDTTLYLFRDEYHVPVLPPELAAIVGTFGELFFPVLLFLGLFGRLGALGMSAVNVMAVVSYAHVLLSPGFEGAIAQHVLWGFMLVVLIVYGPGRFSLDHLLFNRKEASGPV